ncbi:glycerol uptake operon antiterminator regulatory protein [Oceanobacillus oncorhynchi subsp. incaldanensis]|uniref:Glycerol uptake operon antiterminator regulatory protein n=1 Tax=Oceanobacillus oncorhynchi TaxID=545501 RepID=A0A0A1MQ95_9BACI|nr:glycerol-3-phosphate responsive antiterminator [Oceanobacillus oncorhynchi]UUI39140.1 glycerol-3-phosphate responsive antiterminator [Oceanobacillus oncorhynchi]GIO17867.1 glycerol uptake operon antiterminator regulatory protein [Oceanobacillus oncorhynchi subsp. incaldanensis]CEI81226.1 Glycerol-3-phosphate responsive antiterminator [Oceanobacillus oncorhynchi]
MHGVLPAVRRMKDFEKVLESNHEHIIILESRLVQLKSMIDYAHRANKKVLVHFDLIQGLKADEYGMEFLQREIKPDGILTTRGNVIAAAKKHKLLAIQRVFILDSAALEQSIKLIQRFHPDYVEILPGLMPEVIEEITGEIDIPVIAGGLIKEEEQVKAALDTGAVAVSTSSRKLWD